MFRHRIHFALTVATTGLVATMVPVVAHADPPTELMGTGGPVIPLKNEAMITKDKKNGGYLYRAGQQDSHLTVDVFDGKLRYLDTGTERLNSIPKACSRLSPDKGIGALCRIPDRYDADHPMFLQVWPRLGDDYVDMSSLSSTFRAWVLADAGFDTVLTGDGDDFVNGAQDDDYVSGGAGDDWLRTGIGDDEIWGGSGNDQLVGTDGDDVIHGGDGNDWIGGGDQADKLYADAGKDVVSCGNGGDNAWVDGSDRSSACESLTRTSS